MHSDALGSVRKRSVVFRNFRIFCAFFGKVLSISSAILFAIGITIDIAIGFIFLLFFSLGGLPPPKREKNEKDKANGNVNGNANGKKISTTYT